LFLEKTHFNLYYLYTKVTIEYKGYKGSIEYSEMDGLFYGKVQGIFSLISYEGKASKSLFRIFMVQWMII